MIAFILAAGIGSRLRPLTLNKHKCLIEVYSGSTILDIQLKTLKDNGIKNVIMAIGHYSEKIENYVLNKHPEINFTFVLNQDYANTNCIYSMWLCRRYLNNDLIFLTGDLIFESKVIHDIINSDHKNLMYVNPDGDLNNEDFKVRTRKDGFIDEISVDLTGPNLKACYPLYKLSSSFVKNWMQAIEKLVSKGKKNLYAEEAFNSISKHSKLLPMYSTDFCMEIDDHNDLSEAKKYYANYV